VKKFFRYINDEVLVKAANLNTAYLSVKLVGSIIITKCIAVFIGAEGLALIGNLRNFLSSVQSLAIAGLYNGLVKFIGQAKHNAIALTKTLSTGFYFGFFATMLLSFLCYYNAELINNLIFADNYRYTYVIQTLAVVLPFYALNMFAFSIMNGFAKYKILLVINIIGKMLGLLVAVLLIWQENIDGALIAVVITPALNVLITLVGILNRKNLIDAIRIDHIDFTVLKNLSPYMLMALVSTSAIPVVLIIVRNYIIAEIGLKEAGYWEAVNRVSDYYLMFINSLMILYILPRFSEIQSKLEFRKEVFSFYKTVMPFFAFVLFVVYLSRSVLVGWLFTEEFRPVEELFGYQILGDFMRVLSMVIAYKFLAKKMFSHFIILEIFLFVIIYVSSISFVDMFGLKGAVMAHCLSYSLYLAIILLLFGSSLFGILPHENANDA
jgi:O-antigen/teichoic acid export membrane protein